MCIRDSYLGQQVYDIIFVRDNVANFMHIVGGVCGTVFGYVNACLLYTSCRQTRPYLGASFFIISIVSRLWSMATLVVSKMGASSCWQGATSLCLVLAGRCV